MRRKAPKNRILKSKNGEEKTNPIFPIGKFKPATTVLRSIKKINKDRFMAVPSFRIRLWYNLNRRGLSCKMIDYDK
jgi:hypothetical protein